MTHIEKLFRFNPAEAVQIGDPVFLFWTPAQIQTGIGRIEAYCFIQLNYKGINEFPERFELSISRFVFEGIAIYATEIFGGFSLLYPW